jgi:hypothetical protein
MAIFSRKNKRGTTLSRFRCFYCGCPYYIEKLDPQDMIADYMLYCNSHYCEGNYAMSNKNKLKKAPKYPRIGKDLF